MRGTRRSILSMSCRMLNAAAQKLCRTASNTLMLSDSLALAQHLFPPFIYVKMLKQPTMSLSPDSVQLPHFLKDYLNKWVI